MPRFAVNLFLLFCFVKLSAQTDSKYINGWTTSIEYKHDKEVHKCLEVSFPHVQKYLRENIIYPFEAVKNNIQGCVSIQYRIKPSGDITDIKLIKGIDKLLDTMALSTIKEMPKYLMPNNMHCCEKDSAIVITNVNFSLKGALLAEETENFPLPENVCFVGEITVIEFYSKPKPKLIATITKVKRKWWQFWK